jgi:hypothetical protein
MMARGMVIALVAMLGACTSAREIYLPNGSLGHDIRCDGFANRMENCFQRAGEICGAKGYDLVTPQGIYIGVNSLFVRCKE